MENLILLVFFAPLLASIILFIMYKSEQRRALFYKLEFELANKENIELYRSILNTENETGVSDADSKDGVLHSVMECNAHGKTDELNAATGECGYEKITDDEKECSHIWKFAPKLGEYYCRKCRGHLSQRLKSS